MSYASARRLLLAAGLIVLAVVAAVMYARRVDTVEVGATLLFVPVFVAFVLWGLRGGIAAGVLAALGYAALRYPAIDAVGAGRFVGLMLSRTVAYLAFGIIGGWATRQLEMSLTKLELYDQIDDATGLYNARFFVQDLDLEMSRSRRYQTLFSVAMVEVPNSTLEPLARRPRARLIRELGRLLGDSVRTVDRAAHAAGAGGHYFAAILPETGAEGASIFTERLAEKVGAYIARQGASLPPEGLQSISATFPGDDALLGVLKEEFEAIDRAEHPESAAAGVGAG